MRRAKFAVMLSLLSACGGQPKLTWDYPVSSDPVIFQICHVDRGQTEEVCRRVEEPQQQSQGEKVLYTVPLTRSESKAERIGVVACRGKCGPTTWMWVGVK